MLTRGRMIAAALTAGAVATGVPSWASPPAPAPTASVATYVQGQQLPASVMTASWSKVVLGCAGELAVSGTALSGATTVARAAMTSKWFRPRHGMLMSMSGDQGGSRTWRPFPEGFDMKLRVREKGHRWTPWFGTGVWMHPATPELPSVLFQLSMGIGVVLSETSRHGQPLPVQQVQVRITDTVTSTGQVDDRFPVKMGC